MERDAILAAVHASLAAIANPAFFALELSYQGELLVQLRDRLPLADPVILQQELQKQLQRDGLDIRPDIVLHEPFDATLHNSRAEGNYAVLELKRKASVSEAIGDFESLIAMMRILDYPLGIFINIGSSRTHRELVPKDFRSSIVTFAVDLVQGKAKVARD